MVLNIMKNSNVTIKEIAHEANVSIATVSMILNNKECRISDSTRKRVVEIASNLNYIPNTMARSLVTKRTKTIGLIMPDITNPFFPEIARGAEDKASQENYSIIYCNTDDDIGREEKYIETLTEKMVDGIILAHSSDREGGNTKLKKCRVPIVLIDRDYDIPNIAGKVMVNNKDASKKAVEYLYNKGYKKIVYIAGSMNTQTAKDRLEGYKSTVTEKGLHLNENNIKVGEYKSRWGEKAVWELIEDGIEFDAIYCGNDLIAIGAIKTLKKNGIKIPEDVGVIGFDDIYMSSMLEPELTTVKQPNYEMGYKATELLIKSIELKKKTDTLTENVIDTVLLETELIIRKST